MTVKMINERDLEFMLYELFASEELLNRARYQDHDRQTFNEVINTAKAIAEKHFLPIRQKLDSQQPSFDGKKVHTLAELKPAIAAVNASGISAAMADYDLGGMQLPPIIASAANTYLTISGGVAMGYNMLTTANVNLLLAHASNEIIDTWVKPMLAGRFMGTMAMTEPGCGSGLGDLTTKAIKADDGTYRISGSKIFISGGDHDLSENIVHLVLARVQGAPKGVKGISLFVVPKYLLHEDGSIGAENEVALSGLFHKMGGRAHSSTALSFGENNGATGYLVGEENQGLKYMFHMMNEARILVGTSAAVLATAGFQYSLDYARNRPQGRLPSCKDPLSPMVNIIEHADVRRMLLAQKAYAEGAMALVLYGTQLSDDEKTAPTPEAREHAHTLLDFLTPIIKSWPAEYGPKANSYAIQVLGGHGYINEHPVEMFYRDNRLNAIHEGTTGIQSLDLLTRKVPMNNMKGFLATINEINSTIAIAKNLQGLTDFSEQLADAVKTLQTTTQTVLTSMSTKSIDLALANSVSYLSMFGHVVIAWLWLKQSVVASNSLVGQPHQDDEAFYQGKLQACQYFYRSELPKISLWENTLKSNDSTSFDMKTQWF